ncbi:nicotinate phosphoribosyltransferase [Methanobacterium petrolearium]|uniref:nicotinate phosphoribosyltransferase n=1 Tax=Methanobacterium petrolearium TaxID=710190 RepID=UPI001AE3269D|nr:nicotinate phosphoribosyltransferase [Methanobacterium petrolearium]MBP1946564.1 nicotinate phosphoribosyltransferase [Methanobacterium petrolearium]BDZ69911.1 nicotinate phosphoribosyltransferase [Methanobacterium petrolearium]
MFHVAEEKEIMKGDITDVYFQRTLEILKNKDINPKIRAEFAAKTLPGECSWAVLAGLEEVALLLKDLPVKVRAMREGTVFYPNQPVLEIEGCYQDFCAFETTILGLLCQATGIATQAARYKKLAGERLVMSFGARRMHPAIAPMIERNAFIGGCDGVSVIKGGEIIGEDPLGTIPHALVICIGSTVDAVKAFDEVIDPDVNRVALIDTFNDEKFECLNVAEAMGEKLYAVRFDTPSSRRGDFYRILEEARWELDLRGFEHVKIFVSGGIKEINLPELNPLVDAYGIGTSISNAPVVDFSMDIVEVDGEPLAKRGKCSGAKNVIRCQECYKDHILPLEKEFSKCECGGKYESLLYPLIKKHKILPKRLEPGKIREYVLGQLKHLPEL